MKKIILIAMAVDQDNGSVDENFFLEVEGLPQAGVDAFVKDLTAFGDASEQKGIQAGIKKHQIKKHHHKK